MIFRACRALEAVTFKSILSAKESHFQFQGCESAAGLHAPVKHTLARATRSARPLSRVTIRLVALRQVHRSVVPPLAASSPAALRSPSSRSSPLTSVPRKRSDATRRDATSRAQLVPHRLPEIHTSLT